MKDRIAEIIRIKGLTAQKFAQSIGVPPASISHIFSGRNEASRKLIYAILDTYKDINPEWLMFGNGNCLKNSANDEELIGVFNDQNSDNSNDYQFFEPKKEYYQDENSMTQIDTNTEVDIYSDVPEKQAKKIKKIIIFYEDNTFELFENI